MELKIKDYKKVVGCFIWVLVTATKPKSELVCSTGGEMVKLFSKNR